VTPVGPAGPLRMQEMELALHAQEWLRRRFELGPKQARQAASGTSADGCADARGVVAAVDSACNRPAWYAPLSSPANRGLLEPLQARVHQRAECTP